ncbi:MAG: oligosaccharide flippase family protein [Flavobacteriales bacterium]|jgi:O-antigen/teichoic acid export membrane protein|nr:oligosaccharide flippase family protein [Flavobacteriales bacterium]NCG30290.1 oligosaccharide flippase family protein [Bacteroidota bacterium]MBT3963432.1 oligosaccharide flippase family protein [Flavobacteriales bacterium]MBT4704457.1 oligosaccharide flippase family protein [Flavobacteriales bacterium]MBT4931212.1 oligosaccharide flippase family protein [Flavobacteriales bacterium]
MGIIRREGALSSVVIYLGIVLGFVLSLFVYPKYLATEEIGLIRVLLDLSGIIVPFMLLGVQNTYVKYHPYFKNSPDQLGAFQLLSMLIPGLGAVLGLGVFYILKPFLISTVASNSPLLVEYIDWLPALIFMISGAKLIRAYFRSEFNITISNFYESIFLRLGYITTVLVYFYLDLGVQWLVYLFILTYALVFISMIISYLSRNTVRINSNFKAIDKEKRREVFSYGLFAILNVLSGSMIIKIDSWMISSLAGLGATGIYAIALALGNVIELPRKSITQISVPVISNSWKNGNMANIRDIYHRTSLNQFIASGLIFTLVWLNIQDLFDLIPNGDVFRQGVWVVFFIGLAKIFSSATGINNEILLVSDHYRYSLAIRLLLVVTAIITNLYFIPIYGITGAALATSISILSNNLLLFLFVWVKLKMQPFKVDNLYALIWLSLIFFVAWLVPIEFDYPLINIVMRSALILVMFVFIVMRMRFSEDLKEMVLLSLKKVGIKL